MAIFDRKIEEIGLCWIVIVIEIGFSRSPSNTQPFILLNLRKCFTKNCITVVFEIWHFNSMR